MTTFIRVLWWIASILLIGAGVCCFFVPTDIFTDFWTYVIGGAVLISGILTMVAYFQRGLGKLGGGWMLFNSALTIILGIALLCREVLAPGIIPYLFTPWIISIGLSKLIGSFDLKALGYKTWWIALVFGIIELIIGFITIFDPFNVLRTMGIFSGVFLVLSGLSIMCDLIFLWGFNKTLRGSNESNISSNGYRAEGR